MKLHEIAEVNDAKLIRAWFDDWCHVDGGAENCLVDSKYSDQPKMRTKDRLTFKLPRAGIVFDPPFDRSFWGKRSLMHLTIANTFDGEGPIIPNFEKMPDTDYLDLGSCTISSLKGIEKLSHLNIIRFYGKHVDIDGGLLRLLKMPNLGTISLMAIFKQNAAQDLIEALSIVRKHLENKDLVECQSELIDAGLEKYAKL